MEGSPRVLARAGRSGGTQPWPTGTIMKDISAVGCYDFTVSAQPSGISAGRKPTMKTRYVLGAFLVALLVMAAGWFNLHHAWRWAGHTEARPGTIPATAERIITLAPNITEIVFALGAGDRVVGVSEFCKYPPEATRRQHCGGWANPNFEVMTALRPDLILIMGKHEQVRRFCRRRGIACRGLDMDTTDEILQGIETLGHWIGLRESALSMTARIRAQLDEMEGRRPNREQWPRVFVGIGRQPGDFGRLHTISTNGFIAEALRRAGGKNIFDRIEQAYPRISKESLLARRPEVIIELAPDQKNDPGAVHQLKDDWARMSTLPAVQHDRIHILTEDYMLSPGPRLVAITERFRAVLHPSASETSSRRP